jgi:hypothetical protein
MKTAKLIRHPRIILAVLACSFTLEVNATVVPGDLEQQGQITINPGSAPGSSPVTLTLQGPRTGTGSAPYGLTLSYEDAAEGSVSTGIFRIHRLNGQYQWQLSTSDPVNPERLAMQLGNDHSLLLTDPTEPGRTIELRPGAPNDPDKGIFINGQRIFAPDGGLSLGNGNFQVFDDGSFTTGLGPGNPGIQNFEIYLASEAYLYGNNSGLALSSLFWNINQDGSANFGNGNLAVGSDTLSVGGSWGTQYFEILGANNSFRIIGQANEANGEMGLSLFSPKWSIMNDGSASFAGGVAIIDGTGFISGNGFTSGARSYLDEISGWNLLSGNWNNGNPNALSIDYANRVLYDANGSTTVFCWGQGDGSASFYGNVGIGTTNPEAKLDLGSSLATPKLYIYNDGQYVDGIGQWGNEMRFFMDTAQTGNAKTIMTFGKQTHAGQFTEALRITGDGNVGIGTTTPQVKLHVAGDARVDGALTLNGNPVLTQTAANTLYVPAGQNLNVASTGNVGIGTTNPLVKLHVNGNARVDGPLAVSGALTASGGLAVSGALTVGGVSVLTQPIADSLYVSKNATQLLLTGPNFNVTASGNVGIGTATPTQKLDVNGTIVSSATVYPNFQFNSARRITFGEADPQTADTGNVVQFGSGLTPSRNMTLIISKSGLDSGFLGNNGSSFIIGEQSARPIIFKNNMSYAATDLLASGSERMRIAASGDVGIGTPTPGGRLDVQGGFSFFNGLRLKGDDADVIFNGNTPLSLTVNNGVPITFKQYPSGEKMRVAANGNVGIGNANPTSQLSVGAPVVAGQPVPVPTSIGLDSTLGTGQLGRNFKLKLYENTGTPTDKYGLGVSNGLLEFAAGTSGDFAFFSGSTPSELLRIKSSGNVGIGITTPAAKLHVVGTARVDGALTVTGGLNLGGVSVLTQPIADSLYVSKNATQLLLSGPNFNVTSGGNVGIGTTTPQAKLDVAGDARINGWIYANNIFLDGNQVLTAANMSLALGSNSSAMQYAFAFGVSTTAYGTGSFATGSLNSAEGADSTAMGHHTRAVGQGSTSFGLNSYAGGDFSTAMGASWTLGQCSVAMGSGTSAIGFSTTSMGGETTAYGNYSTAAGQGTYAQSYAQFAIGQFNVKRGDGNSWVPADDLFVIGNGTDDTHRANAFTVRKDGGMAAGLGVQSSAAAQVVVGKYNDTRTADAGTDHTQGVFVVGVGTTDAATDRKNALRVTASGAILIQPSGDISMGGFQNGSTP